MFFGLHRESFPFKKIAEGFLGQQVIITTSSGSVEGTVTEVGSTYAELLELEGTTVLVNFKSTISIEPV